MRIAFYAPMKPPTAPVPSGDRQMGRSLMAALGEAGHRVELVSRFRSWDGAGDAARQRRIAEIGRREAARVVRRLGGRPRGERPDLWFSYHVYHKAPDWIGPHAAKALGIPYVIGEASFAPKQEGGRWAMGHEAARRAIGRAAAVIGLNRGDAACVRPLLAAPERLRQIRPFTDIAPFARAAEERAAARRAICETHGLDGGVPILLAVAMMRPGDKLESYRLLGRALARLERESWQLLVVGDGPARPEVEAALGGPAAVGRVRYAGVLDTEALAACYAAADILVWPAIREAYGVALIEAQAAGLPVVAGGSGGVPDIVRDGRTGLLAAVGDEAAFADAVGALIAAPECRVALGRAARETAARDHSIAAAARALDAALRAAMAAAAA